LAPSRTSSERLLFEKQSWRNKTMERSRTLSSPIFDDVNPPSMIPVGIGFWNYEFSSDEEEDGQTNDGEIGNFSPSSSVTILDERYSPWLRRKSVGSTYSEREQQRKKLKTSHNQAGTPQSFPRCASQAQISHKSPSTRSALLIKIEENNEFSRELHLMAPDVIRSAPAHAIESKSDSEAEEKEESFNDELEDDDQDRDMAMEEPDGRSHEGVGGEYVFRRNTSATTGTFTVTTTATATSERTSNMGPINSPITPISLNESESENENGKKNENDIENNNGNDNDYYHDNNNEIEYTNRNEIENENENKNINQDRYLMTPKKRE